MTIAFDRRAKTPHQSLKRLWRLGLFLLGSVVLAQSPGTQAPAEASKKRPLISVKEGALTVQAQNTSLRELVENIASQARIAVQFAGEVADRKISVEYRNFPLEAALQEILNQYDAFYFYGIDEKPPARLHIVWVYPKTKGRGLEPVPPEQWASTKELKEKFAGKDAEARAKAIAALALRLGEGARNEVLEALRDPDAKVRTRALYKAQEAGVSLPHSLLASMAVSDESSFVRFLALDGLSADREMQGVVERALNDPDQYVQAKAKEILERWRWASQPPQTPPRPVTQQEMTQQQQPAPR